MDLFFLISADEMYSSYTVPEPGAAAMQCIATLKLLYLVHSDQRILVNHFGIFWSICRWPQVVMYMYSSDRKLGYVSQVHKM